MNALIDPQIEMVLQETILPDLEKGRKDFDRLHTVAVVHWMKHLIQIAATGAVDSQVLVTAAYAHDWGYIGLFEGVDSSDLATIEKMKPLHMDRGSEMIAKLIDDQLSDFFSDQQKQRVAHLVLMHDRVEALESVDELLLMEADTLGMLDADRVKPTFSKAANEGFIQQEIYGRRLPRFIHPEARTAAEALVQKRLDFYADRGS